MRDGKVVEGSVGNPEFTLPSHGESLPAGTRREQGIGPPGVGAFDRTVVGLAVVEGLTGLGVEEGRSGNIMVDGVGWLESGMDEPGSSQPGEPGGALKTQGMGAPGIGVFAGTVAGLRVDEARVKAGSITIKNKKNQGMMKRLLAKLVLVLDGMAVAVGGLGDAEDDVETDISDSVRVVERVKWGSVKRLVLINVDVL